MKKKEKLTEGYLENIDIAMEEFKKTIALVKRQFLSLYQELDADDYYISWKIQQDEFDGLVWIINISLKFGNYNVGSYINPLHSYRDSEDFIRESYSKHMLDIEERRKKKEEDDMKEEQELKLRYHFFNKDRTPVAISISKRAKETGAKSIQEP